MKNQWTFGRRAFGLAVLIATVASGSAHAATPPAHPAHPAPPVHPAPPPPPPAPTSACSSPDYALSQPFLGSHDSSWYTLAPGQDADSFNGAGWTLTGGAAIVTTTLPDGTTGTVLDLPAGSTAVSPQMCVSSAYPTARVDVRDMSGGPSVRMFVAYTGTKNAGNPSPAGNVPGNAAWSVSPPIQLHPGNLFGWQEAQYTFEGGTHGSDAQLDDFYVDPRCRL